ncbi:MAG: tetratricopeptide repeat protein [Patescibacteria group bacterium]|nr:tetratricopeptide repeat protein [Patescibacteria group bacterium]
MKIDLRRGGGPMPQRPQGEPTPTIQTLEQPRREQEIKNSLTPRILNWVIIGAVYLLTFLLPIFFLPNVPSVLELNKQMLLIVLGGIAFLSWIGKLAWEGRIRIKKNFLLLPVIVLLLILALGTIFSAYRDQSMWGSFGTESLSLVTIIAFVAAFLVITNNFDSKKKVSYLILVLISSSFLASLYAIFQMFGKFIFKNPALAQNSFNSVGSVYAFSAFIGAILILAVATILEKQPMAVKIALIVFSLFFVFVLIAVNFRTTLIAFLVGMAVLLGLAIITSGSEEKNRALVLPMVVLTLVLLATLIGKNGSVVKVQLPVEVSLSQSASFDVLKTMWKEKFLLGPGLSMYDLAYLKGKPSEINLTNFWTVKFNEASSRFFTLATTAGFLGAAAFIFLIGSMLVYMFSSLVKIFGRKEEGTYTLVGVTAMWIYLTILQFVCASNITLDFTWWIATAAFVVLTTLVFRKKEEIISETSSPRVSLILSFVFVAIIVGFISLIFLEGQKYAAAAAYNKALASDTQGGNLEDLVGKLGRVTGLDPSRDLYHRNLSVALFAFLNQKVSEKGISNLSENDRAEISTLYFAAEEQANAAINLNPKNSDNLVQLAQINQNVIGSKDGAEDAAIKAYRDALNYNPKDPSIYYQIGQVYLLMADMETAKAAAQQQGKQAQLPEKAKENIALARQNFEKAVGEKGNYIPAQFMVAVCLDRLGEIDQAIAKLEESKKMNPQDAGILFQLGVFYYKAEKYNQARAELEQAVKLAENYSNARYFLGLAYDKLDDKKSALEQFKKIAELNPDNEDVKKIVSNLEAGKKALDGMDVTGSAQGTQGGQNAPAVQRDQEPVPPETPIQGPDQQNQPPQENPNP